MKKIGKFNHSIGCNSYFFNDETSTHDYLFSAWEDLVGYLTQMRLTNNSKTVVNCTAIIKSCGRSI